MAALERLGKVHALGVGDPALYDLPKARLALQQTVCILLDEMVPDGSIR